MSAAKLAAAVPGWLSTVIDTTDLTSDPEVFGVITAVADPEAHAFGSDAERLAAIRAVLGARRSAHEAMSRAHPGDLAVVVYGPTIGRLVRVLRDNGADLEVRFEDDPDESAFGLDYDQVRKVEVPR